MLLEGVTAAVDLSVYVPLCSWDDGVKLLEKLLFQPTSVHVFVPMLSSV
jgi:hypothetical protein